MRTKPVSIAGWRERFLEQYPLEATRCVQVEGCTFRLRSNSPELLDVLARDYSSFVDDGVADTDIDVVLLEAPQYDPGVEFAAFPPGPGKTVIKDEYVDLPDGRLLRKRQTGMLFTFGAGDNLAVGPCLENRNQVINFINNRFIQYNIDRGYLLCHAAGVTSGGVGVSLAGSAGAGKSTLAMHVLSAGHRYVSNDRLLIRRSVGRLEMLGVPKLPRVNPGTILNNPDLHALVSAERRRAYEELPAADLWKLEDKYDVHVDKCFGPGRVRLRSSLDAIVILTWKWGGGAPVAHAVDLHQRRDLLDRFIKVLGAHYRVRPGCAGATISPDEYLNVLGDCPVHEITGGVDFGYATEYCSGLLA